jgi:hypothetical protein
MHKHLKCKYYLFQLACRQGQEQVMLNNKRLLCY